MQRFRILNVLLVALILLAGWRTFDVWRREAPPGEAGQEGRGPQTLPAPARRPAIPQFVDGIARKDLFDVSRREATDDANVPTPQASPPPPPTLKLAGVLFIGMDPEAVVIDSAQGNKQIRLRVGEEISGYEVKRISIDHVALGSSAGEEVVVPLIIGTAGKSPASLGPGGVGTPKKAAARRPPAQRGRGTAVEAGADAKTEAQRRREDARRRAERARERLKRLRAEAAKNR